MAENNGEQLPPVAWLFGKISSLQTWVIKIIQRCTKNLSLRSKKILLGIFCLGFGGSSLQIIVDSLFYKQYKAPLSVSPITMPRHQLSKSAGELQDMMISERDYQQLKLFDKYCDSLKMSPSGRMVLDSISRSRPGLIDSVNIFEQLYLLQQAKKGK